MRKNAIILAGLILFLTTPTLLYSGIKKARKEIALNIDMAPTSAFSGRGKYT
ncbi:MAG: hypothetical protein WD426_15445 [Anditalea sp.]